ncbi:conserved hypothetical protein [Ixodes scapularis]|uniref:F-box only protein 25 n=1 Tax=Ixodes scapularis TaxID=6945 RepID=B7QHE1_IXOSC|nr:conserved hypothetical protein [Ixodes scapularis]|eukprot:XP_002414598.1 conserved hypothetical protein [Ixodes scapularis]
MPFIGRDWRSPGEAWVKTGEGWEKKKILEFYCCSADRCTNVSPKELSRHIGNFHPTCTIFDLCFDLLLQVAGYNTISEAFRRLDFRNGIKDVRRFNYICKLLHLLITENLTTLSGCASRVLFTMLEEVASQVADSRQNTHILQLLLGDLERTLRKYHCWGRPLGSSQLWEQHLATLQRIWEVQRHIELGGPPLAKGTPQLPHLPPELLREVLLRLADYRDLGSSGQAHPVLEALLEEEHVWRQLCLFHFGPQKLEAWRKAPSSGSGPQWRLLFHRLRKKHGLREEYADSLLLCRHCRCLFWKSFGHPCLKVPRDEETSEEGDAPLAPTSVVPVCIPVTPQAFLQYFSL